MKKYKAFTSSLRHVLLIDKARLSSVGTVKNLTKYYKYFAGRNTFGKCVVYNRGGGHKKLYRVLDYKRYYLGVPAVVCTVEYDPNRSSFIALILYVTGFYSYIIAPFQVFKKDSLITSNVLPLTSSNIGNVGQLLNIAIGSLIHNLELIPGLGGKFMRSAGVFGILLRKDVSGYSVVKLCSGEKRYVLSNCFATIGSVSNSEHKYINLGKAGRKRWLGLRPKVRGVAMNPVDHPHGGNTSKGKIPMTPWSILTKGKLTRKIKNKFIVKY